MTTLDGNVIIKKGGGGTPAPDTPSAKPKWTGHADAEGLKAIGWTDEDIAYYQQHGVNWNAEDDEWHKVSEDNKALYGVVTVENAYEYADRIIFLPKLDMSGVDSLNNAFYELKYMEGMPLLNTSNVTDMACAFWNCDSLTCIPPFNTSNCESFSSAFTACYSLMYVPPLDISKAKDIDAMFSDCYTLQSIPLLEVKSSYDHGYGSGIVSNSPAICDLRIKGLAENLNLQYLPAISKWSLLYIINNEAATKAITIKLNYYAWKRLNRLPDIVAALTNHPNITLASA